jgi:hypothetical protein
MALQDCDDPPPDLVSIITGVVEFKVGDRARRAANWLAVHPADITNQRLRSWKDLQDFITLRIKLGAVDCHKADIIGPGVQT